ncbi:MAG: response regulator [Nitrospinota bacterium]|nr:response regulator [Nitrospinota bacterium]
MAKILAVDDEPLACDFLKKFLGRQGYEVSVDTTGKQALELIQAERPHLVLLDIRMPGMDGMEVMRRAKDIDPALGFIMVTALHDDRIGRKALSEGAYDYITKPVDIEYLKTSMSLASLVG